jgi:hypothetical protein
LAAYQLRPKLKLLTISWRLDRPSRRPVLTITTTTITTIRIVTAAPAVMKTTTTIL